MTTEVEVACKQCGSRDISGYDRVIGYAAIGRWTLNDEGVAEPSWSGGTDVDWNTQEAVNLDLPYWCGDCSEAKGLEDLSVNGQDKYEPPVKAERDTIAYVAIGARDILNVRTKAGVSAGPPESGGELEYISSVCDYADVLETAWFNSPKRDEFNGVFLYDVAEPFGAIVGEHLLTGNSLTHADARVVADNLIAGS